VNAALYLRRPLLLTGQPGTGKSSLIYAVAYELGLGPVLKWSITSKATLKNGLYDYDALRRLNDIRQREAGGRKTGNAQIQAVDDIGNYLTLGPLGAALYPTDWPRALLIDEIDKADLDLPNDLLNIFEDGEFLIPELARGSGEKVMVQVPGLTKRPVNADGKVVARQFPFVVLTSNNEREFPAPFLRRCIRAQMPEPTVTELSDIVASHLGLAQEKSATDLINSFDKDKINLATDQLLNAVFLTIGSESHQATLMDQKEREAVIALVLKHLS
jgi:MoxR-like ATPase